MVQNRREKRAAREYAREYGTNYTTALRAIRENRAGPGVTMDSGFPIVPVEAPPSQPAGQPSDSREGS